MLGHNLPFSYCRSMNNGLPCRKIRDCTFQLIGIDEYLKENFTYDELKTAFTPADDRLTSILKIVEKNRRL